MEEIIDEREIKNLETLSEFQKDVVAMLKVMGYKYKYNKIYTLNDRSLPVDVAHIKSLNDLFKTAFDKGATEKVWEIQRVLQVS